MDLSIIIVNYNSGHALRRCLESIHAHVRVPHYEVLVVDNASRDGSQQGAEAVSDRVTLLQQADNCGFGTGVNRGAAAARAGFLLVLNPDIVVGPESVDALLTYMQANPQVGLCAPKLLNEDGSLQYSCRSFYTFWTLVLRRTPVGRWYPHTHTIRRHLMLDWDHAKTRPVEWVLGAAMLLRRQAFQDAQIMDERFFLYFEDVDVCLRLSSAGWQVIYHPEAIMVHTHQRASAKGWFARARLEHLRSWLKFEWKHRCAPYFGADPILGLTPYQSVKPHA